jgi:hypothetical protein
VSPEDVAAREAIRATLAAYHYAGDRGRIDDLVATFTEDGVLELSTGVHRGRDSIRAALAGVGGGTAPAFLHHHLTTAYLELTGPGTAKGSCYFLVMSPAGLDHSGRYADVYAEVDGRWLIAHRKAVVAWASPESVVGATAG